MWSAADAAAWLEENYPDAADKARAAGVTGSVLCGMPEEELKEVLGLSLIARRKVGGKLKALHEVAKARAAAAKRAAGPPLARILAEEGGKANERNLKAYEEAQKNEALNKDKIDDQLLEEQAVCGPCKWAVGQLHDAVAKAGSAWAKAEIREAKRAELQALGFDEPPGYSIVLVGDTGAGKSTLLNAALGEAAVLPTSGYRACTRQPSSRCATAARMTRAAPEPTSTAPRLTSWTQTNGPTSWTTAWTSLPPRMAAPY